MSILQSNALTIEIKGALYAVEAIPAGEFGTSAVRVTKLVNGEVYDLIRTDANVLECTCPDFVCRHEGNGTCCKHLAFAVANGLLPVARPGVPPITRKDMARAAAFGIRLPVAAKAEAPKATPVVEFKPLDLATVTLVVAAPGCEPIVRTTAPRPADVREMAEWLRHVESLPVAAPAIDEDDVESDPSEWPAWTDERWTVADPDDFAADPDDFAADPGDFAADPGDFAADPGDFAADPGDFAADPGDFTADPGDFAADPGDFAADPDDFVADPLPAESNPVEFNAPSRTMTDAEFRRWKVDQAAGYRPTWEGDAFRPEPIDSAWWAGFCLGIEGEYPAPPARYSDRERSWFTSGRLVGWQQSEEGQDWAADMEALRDRPGPITDRDVYRAGCAS